MEVIGRGGVRRAAVGNGVSYMETIRIGLINQFTMLKISLWQSQ